jgi:hypothetical protein
MVKMKTTSLAALLALSAALHAQQPTVLTTGLIHPAKMIPGPGGSLIVSESGDKANTGRLSIVSATGTRQTLIDALPAGPTQEDADGPTGVVLDGDTLYLALGEGDQLVAGTAQGTQIPNPKGPSSPILASILKINISKPLDGITAPFTLKAADHNTLADGGTVTLDNGAGATATISILSDFRYRPDPVAIYRNSHPYALTKSPTDSKSLYLADAGLNAIVQISTETGRWKTITKFPPQPNKGTTPPPVAEAVPDSIRFYNGQLLVTLLTGFPFTPGNSKVMSVDPATGAATPLFENLSATIDVAPRVRFLRTTEFLVLEYSSNFLQGAPGQVRRITPFSSDVIVDKLNAPSSMVYDAASQMLYIASRADGTILKVQLPN